MLTTYIYNTKYVVHTRVSNLPTIVLTIVLMSSSVLPPGCLPPINLGAYGGVEILAMSLTMALWGKSPFAIYSRRNTRLY